jgi:hypothetical protein
VILLISASQGARMIGVSYWELLLKQVLLWMQKSKVRGIKHDLLCILNNEKHNKNVS